MGRRPPLHRVLVAVVGLSWLLPLGARQGEAVAQAPADHARAASAAPTASKPPALDPAVARAVEGLEKRVVQIKGRFGLAVVDVQRGRVLIAKNAGEPLNPA